ncbi:MAG: mechanosensitive ion channel family protein, partial [Methanomassiliicoccales archaeon]
MDSRKRSSLLSIGGILVLVIVIAAILYIFELIIRTYANGLVSYTTVIFAALAVVIGYSFITYIGYLIVKILTPLITRPKAVTVKYLFSVVAYIALAFIVFSILKLNLEGLLVGSAFTGIVLGLASQTVLSNFFAGLVLVLARPIAPEERITFATWQYGAIVPSYPP